MIKSFKARLKFFRREEMEMERACSLLKNYEQKAKAPIAITASLVIGIIGAVIAAATLIVSIVALVISINTYNDRYNTAFTDAKSAQEVQFTYKSNGKTSGSASVTMSAGNIYYGYFQISTKVKREVQLTPIDLSVCQPAAI